MSDKIKIWCCIDDHMVELKNVHSLSKRGITRYVLLEDYKTLEKELNKINEDPIDWKGLLIDHCTQCGYPRSNREYQTLESKFEALKKQIKLHKEEIINLKKSQKK